MSIEILGLAYRIQDYDGNENLKTFLLARHRLVKPVKFLSHLNHQIPE